MRKTNLFFICFIAVIGAGIVFLKGSRIPARTGQEVSSSAQDKMAQDNKETSYIASPEEQLVIERLSAGTIPVHVNADLRLIDVNGLDGNLIRDQRVTAVGHNEVKRLSLVYGGGSHPYHRIEERLRYDEDKDHYVVIGQTIIGADHFLVKLRDGIGAAELDALNRNFGTQTLKAMGFANKYVVEIPEPTLDSVIEFCALFEEETTLVERTHVDPLHAPTAIPNDPYWSSQWDKQRINCPDVWDFQTGSTNIIVAVIDTGVDLDHPDLAANLWRNPGEAGELASNGVDDDGNGYVDDWVGWDFGRADNNPDDNGDEDYNGRVGVAGHGTHCSGIIGGIGNNSTQIAGVCWNVTIMALKPFEYFSDYDDMLVWSYKAEEAMQYAADNGAKVTSNSYGGQGSAPYYADGVEYLEESGVLFVAAAGNDGINTDVTPYGPAGVNEPNVIAVASSTSSEVLSDFSNYGATTVDIVAPGSQILSTVPDDTLAYYWGTSMACPEVAGAAALLLSQNPNLTYSECKAALMDSVDTFSAYNGKCVSGGRLNVMSAMNLVAGDDYDNDGIPNEWEERYYGGPINAEADSICANGTNTVEDAYIAGFDPTSPTDGFFISPLYSPTSGGVQWNAVSGRVYTIYWTPNLARTAFSMIETNYVGGAYPDLKHSADKQGFYRIDVKLAP